jgi:hypothetical protein
MTAPRILGVAVGRREAGAGEFIAARFTLLREEVRAQAIDQRAKGRLFPATLKGSPYV